MLAVSAIATALALALALAGTRRVEPGLSAWPRAWATVFFVLLLWPVGLGLVGRLAGVRLQLAAAGVLLVASLGQQLHLGSLPLPLDVQWQVSLAYPGDAVRQRILLPGAGDRRWRQAWEQASRAAVVICTGAAADPNAGVTIALNDGVPVPLASLERSAKPEAPGWYALPLSQPAVESQRELRIVLRREGAEGRPVSICGGRDDARRPGAGGAARWVDGRWSPERLVDRPLPPVGGRPAPGRYYVELRLMDAAGTPRFGIWY